MAGPCQVKCRMGDRLINETVTDLNGRPLPGKMWEGGRGLINETVTDLNGQRRRMLWTIDPD